MKVLIVDDNAHNREVMGAFFLNTHHEIVFASNGLEAVEQAVRTTPDLILMDIRMPRLDGREATELLRRHEALAHTPVIAVTASSLADSRNNARAVFNGYLRKPFLRPELVNAIRLAMASSAAAGKPSPADRPTGPALPLPEHAAAQLRHLYEERWPLLTRTMAVRAIRAFADELETISNAHSCPSLRDYAATLKHQAATFQISCMEKSLADFPALVEILCPPPPVP
jgi:CheY-like chemotaxis protein